MPQQTAEKKDTIGTTEAINIPFLCICPTGLLVECRNSSNTMVCIPVHAGYNKAV